ncbi:unnamed protein product [Durusdinium trenchii]|uniref:Uncharacterized protein n=1 Tax=Durusdinium trenchii TaxID=1381693 RepID=A0ABP0RGT1_9DINO
MGMGQSPSERYAWTNSRAQELEMNELQAQASSDWPPAGGLEEPRRPENPAVLDHAEETGNQRREDLRDLPETATEDREDREGQSKSEVKSQVDEKRQKLDQLQSSSRSGAPAGAVATDPAMVEQKMGETKDEESEVRSAAEIESAAEIGSRGTLKVEKKLLVQTDLDASHSEHEREEKLEGHTLGTGRSNDADGNAGATHLVEADGHENRVADGGTGRPVHEATTGSRVVDFMSASTTRATDARATAADAGGEDDAQEAETTRSSAGPTRAGITDSAGITPGRASSMLETEGRSPMLKSQEADTKDTEKEKSMSQGEEVEDQVREKSKSKSAGRSSSAKEVEPEGVGGVSKEPIVTADTSSDVSQAPKVLWVEPSGAAATSGWQGPLSAREVLKLAEEQTLGPDGLVWGLAGGSVEPPPEGAPGALPLWQCLPELGQHLRRASEAQLQERLQKRFQKMPRQEDATDVLPN